jgi:hypothetical protein
MTAATQSERIATIEALQDAHHREHELNDRVWSAKLDAIDARLRSIERILLEVRIPSPSEHAIDEHKPFVLKPRDVGVMSGSAAMTSLLWLLVQVAQRMAGG